MKKFKFFGRRGLSVILSLALCMGLASPAFAAMDLKDALDDNGSWKEEGYRREQGAFVTDDDGSEREEYYLKEDLQLGQALDIRGDRDVTIDLNGKTLEQTGEFDGTESHSVIDVSEGAKLTIEDSSGKDENGKYVSAGDGKITGGRGTLLTDDYIIVNGGGVAVVGEGSTFTLKGGNITGNSTHEYGYRGAGGGILGAFDATINIEGGTISDNTGGEGGGIALWGATLNMSGGSISNNHADGSAYYGYGGGIAIDGASSVNITGGTFSGNTADNWGDDISIMNYAFDGKIDGSFSGMTFTKDTGDNIYVNTKNQAPVDFHDIKGTASASVTKGSDFRYEGYQVTGEEKEDVTVIKINGDEKKVTIPEGASVTGITEEGYTVTYPGGAELDVEKGVVTSGGSLEITVGKDGETKTLVVESSASGNLSVDHNTGEVTVPQDGKVTDADGNETTYPGGATIKPDGTIEIPEGGKVTNKDGETTYPGGAEIDPEGNIDDKGSSVTKKDNDDGTTTITNKTEGSEDKETTITLPKDENGENKGEVIVDDTGTTTVPGGSSIEDRDENGKKTETTYPDGAVIDPEGNITSKGDTVTKTEKDDGSVDVSKEDKDGNKTEIKVESKDPAEGEEKEDLKINDDGSVDIPEGGKTTDGEGTETTYPDGGKVHPDGTVDGNGSTVTKDKDGNVTITDGEGHETAVKPGESGEGIKVNPDGSVEVPAGGSVTKPDGTTTDLPYGGTVDKNGNVTENENPNPEDPGDNNNPSETPDPETPAPGGDDGFGGASDAGTAINEAEVPLAGIVQVKDVLAELYKHAGSPDGADAEGEYTKAIAWAIANGIVAEDDDVEAVVTVAVLKEMLINYAASVGGEPVSIDGEDDDVVMNCGEILAKFFAAL